MIGHDAMARLPRGQRKAILAEEAKRPLFPGEHCPAHHQST